MSHGRELSQLFKFLLGWFIFSDCFTTIGAVAILFAQSELSAGVPILLGVAIIVPLFAGIGSLAWFWIQKKYNMTSQNILVIQCCICSLLPLYAFLGLFVAPGIYFGLNNPYELPLIAVAHGFLLGATQSSCRVIFSELLPQGHESEFFGMSYTYIGLYEITDKGSSWLGPLVVGYITNTTGNNLAK